MKVFRSLVWLNYRSMPNSDEIETRIVSGETLPAEEQKRRWRRLAELLLKEEAPDARPNDTESFDDKEDSHPDATTTGLPSG